MLYSAQIMAQITLPQNSFTEVMNCPKSPSLEGGRQKTFFHRIKNIGRSLLLFQEILESIAWFLDETSDMTICATMLTGVAKSSYDLMLLSSPWKQLLLWFHTFKGSCCIFQSMLCFYSSSSRIFLQESWPPFHILIKILECIPCTLTHKMA